MRVAITRNEDNNNGAGNGDGNNGHTGRGVGTEVFVMMDWSTMVRLSRCSYPLGLSPRLNSATHSVMVAQLH